MEGVIVNFKGSHHTQYSSQMIIKLNGVNNKDEAKKLIGKTVIWKSIAGKEISGKIIRDHGNRGAVRVKFEKGLPGQALGGKVEVK